MRAAAGKEQVLHVFRTGDSFAEIAVASPTGYPADARAIESSQALLVQKEGILELLKRQPELALRMLGSRSEQPFARAGPPARETLPNVQSESLVKMELTVTKRVLAAELVTVNETFSRTLAKFREQKLIAVKGETVTVLSPVKLAVLLRRNLGQ